MWLFLHITYNICLLKHCATFLNSYSNFNILSALTNFVFFTLMSAKKKIGLHSICIPLLWINIYYVVFLLYFFSSLPFSSSSFPLFLFYYLFSTLFMACSYLYYSFYKINVFVSHPYTDVIGSHL